MNGPSHPGFKSNVPWWRALECIYAGGGRQEEYFSHLSNFPPSPKLNWYSYNTRLDSVHSKPLGSHSLGYVLHPDNLMERTFKAGDCMWTVNQVYNLSQFDAVVLCLLIRNKINLKMKLETVDRILMSRETTVVDPGGGSRGSGPNLSDLTLVQKFLLFFGALLWSVRLCSQRSISHANGDRCSQTVLSEPRPTNQKFLDLPLD